MTPNEISQIALLVAHLVLSGALFYAAFCRAVHSDHRLRCDVRVAFYLLGTTSIMSLVAPVVWAYAPSWTSVSTLFAVVVVQWATANDWKYGVPDKFIKPEYRQRNRRATDRSHA